MCFRYQSLESDQERAYPDIVQVYGIFWKKSTSDIDHWNGVKYVVQFFAKYYRPHAKLERTSTLK